MKFPAFLLWVAEFVEGTCDLTAEDVGAYMRLLCHSWTRGGLPNDPVKLARVAGVEVSAEVLAKFYLDSDGLLKNARQEDERQKQVERSERQSAKGKLSAAARAASRNRGEAVAQPGFNRGSTVVDSRLTPGSNPDETEPQPGPDPVAEANPHDQPELPIQEKPDLAASGEAQDASESNTWTPMSTTVQPRLNHGATGGATETQPHKLSQYKALSPSDGVWPTLEEVQAHASMTGIPPNVAELFWNDMEGRGWQDRQGALVVNWQRVLKSYFIRFSANEHKDRLRNAPRSNTPNRQPLPQHVDRSKGTANEGFELPPGSVTKF